ncbi:MAG: response regulator transcription factor [Bacteroidales bacterium]|nr:response regulator transcription factor [Bacteroidales bacterium]HNW72826.1 response regulator transcription factor [Bacteroidales bacterium]HPS50024.1 response regulator transcription factor [Bacteroidales bacterium]
MNKKIKILLVEDDPNFGSIMKSYLELNDFSVVLKSDGKQGLSTFKSEAFDICILDVMMPEMDGFTLAKEIKKTNSPVPFIFLTAKSLKEDMLEGFRTGADDYITKPFDSEVLLFKLHAILKRNLKSPNNENEPSEIMVGKLKFNIPLRTLSFEKETFQLSPKEANLLKMLCSAKDGILLRKDALEQIWGADNYFNGRSMDVFIARLRKYLKTDPCIEIANIHGNGFRLVIQK